MHFKLYNFTAITSIYIVFLNLYLIKTKKEMGKKSHQLSYQRTIAEKERVFLEA